MSVFDAVFHLLRTADSEPSDDFAPPNTETSDLLTLPMAPPNMLDELLAPKSGRLFLDVNPVVTTGTAVVVGVEKSNFSLVLKLNPPKPTDLLPPKEGLDENPPDPDNEAEPDP